MRGPGPSPLRVGRPAPPPPGYPGAAEQGRLVHRAIVAAAAASLLTIALLALLALAIHG